MEASFQRTGGNQDAKCKEGAYFSGGFSRKSGGKGAGFAEYFRRNACTLQKVGHICRLHAFCMRKGAQKNSRLKQNSNFLIKKSCIRPLVSLLCREFSDSMALLDYWTHRERKEYGGSDQKCFDHHAFCVVANDFYSAIKAAKGV